MTSIDECSKKPIELIFRELQNQKLIRSKVKLKETRRVSNFKADPVFHRRISYNKKMEKLSEDQLRFILLHEECHMISRQYSLKIALLAVIVAIVISYFIQPDMASAEFRWVYIILILFLIPVFFRITRDLRHQEEFNSDLYAAKQLQKHYDISQPSLIAKESFEAVTELMKPRKYPRLNRLIVLFIGVLNTHPAVQKRVQRIRDDVDYKE